MNISPKDKIALLMAVLVGGLFGYLAALAGYGGVVVVGFYAIVVVPLMVIYLADEREILVWHAGLVSCALVAVVASSPLGWKQGFDIGAILMFWIFETIASATQVLVYLGRRKTQKTS